MEVITGERRRITAEAFFALPETNLPAELIDGIILQMTAPELDHQDTTGNFFFLLKLLSQEIGGKAYIAPVNVEFDEYNVPQPDVLWLAPDSKCKPDGKKRLVGAPDLIIEVLSPSTARKDKTDKFLLYEKYGVREYWLTDPSRQQVEVWRLGDTQYMLVGTFGADESFVSIVLNGKQIDLKTVFEAK
jgi:Uma2 family endonuclease